MYNATKNGDIVFHEQFAELWSEDKHSWRLNVQNSVSSDTPQFSTRKSTLLDAPVHLLHLSHR